MLEHKGKDPNKYKHYNSIDEVKKFYLYNIFLVIDKNNVHKMYTL